MDAQLEAGRRGKGEGKEGIDESTVTFGESIKILAKACFFCLTINQQSVNAEKKTKTFVELVRLFNSFHLPLPLYKIVSPNNDNELADKGRAQAQNCLQRSMMRIC